MASLRARWFQCQQCGKRVQAYRWNREEWNKDPLPECCGFTMPDEPPMRRGTSANVIQDSIPGGFYVEHGICNPDGSPRRFDSKREISETARKEGWTRDGETPRARHDRWV